MSQAGKGDSTKGGLPALVYKGEVIHERHEMLSLTDMWKAAGSPENREPFNWARKEGAAFISAVGLSLNLPEKQVLTKRQGRSGGTWGHWQIGLGYAKYLDHDFHMWCNTVVRERMEGASRADHLIAEDLGRDARSAVGGIVKSMVPGLLAEALTLILPSMVREHISGQHHTVVQGVSAGQVIEMAGIAKRSGLHGLPAWVTHRLRRFHEGRGVPVHLAALGSRTALVYDPLLCREWLAAGGKAEIEQKVAERRGHGKFTLVRP